MWEKAVASGCCGESPIQVGSIVNFKDKYSVIGDAWHSNFALHNLAQGASVGIEDGYQMALSIASSSDPYEHFMKMRKKRVENYYRFSYLTQIISAMDKNPLTQKLRDCMKFVPRPINEKIFDFSLKQSLGVDYKL